MGFVPADIVYIHFCKLAGWVFKDLPSSGPWNRSLKTVNITTKNNLKTFILQLRKATSAIMVVLNPWPLS